MTRCTVCVTQFLSCGSTIWRSVPWMVLLGLVTQSAIVSAQQADHDPLGGASNPRPQMQLTREDRQYKRVHQYALRMILLGRDDESETFLTGFLERNPGDPETQYMLGLLHSLRNNKPKAQQFLEAALKSGLPPERIIAGPRESFTNLVETPFYRDLIKRLARTPLHGPLVGSVTDHSARFWIRTASESMVWARVSRQPDMSNPVTSAPARSSSDTDFTAVVNCDDLPADSTVYYQVAIGTAEFDEAPIRSFRTFPSSGPSKFTIAFGGGAGYVPPHERMWDTIRIRKPLALLLLGDNTYIDDPESVTMQHYTYQRRQSRPEFRRLISETAVFTIWDDHDFSTNDSWGGPLVDVPVWKKNDVWRIFRENWNNPGYGGGADQPGCWYRFRIGDVEFFMLDCRYYQTNLRQPDASMLGPAQKKWLKSSLLDSEATIKVLVSSVPWDYRTKGDSLDTWNGFKKERDEVFGFLAEHHIERVLLMSADRHRSDAWKIERPDHYPLYEFNSSRLTNQHVHPEMQKRGAIFSYNRKQSFGLVTFDTSEDSPQVSYSVISIDNETIHTLDVDLDELTYSR